MTGDRLSANYVANYIRPGPSSNLTRGPIALTDTAAVSYFVEGNVVEGRDALTKDNTGLFDRRQVDGRALVTLAVRPFDAPPVRTSSASDALRDVLAAAGATLPRRDPVDARLVREVEQRSGRIIDSQAQVGGWPDYGGTGKLPGGRDRR